MRNKKQEQKTTKKPPEKTGRKKSAVKQIYKTTDGFFNNKPSIRKPRNVAAIEQRKKDGAVALVKFFSEEGKEDKVGKTFIPELTLEPEKHPSLTKKTVVGRQVIIGIKEGDSFKPIYTSDLENTNDKLTRKELRRIRKEVNNNEPKHRKTYKKKIKRWRKGFKK